MNNGRELVIALAEAEQEAVAAINFIMQKNGLPCYLIEPIVGKIHRQLIDGKTAELAEAKAKEESRQNAEKGVDEGSEETEK